MEAPVSSPSANFVRLSSVSASAGTTEMTVGPGAIAASELASARSRSIVACW